MQRKTRENLERSDSKFLITKLELMPDWLRGERSMISIDEESLKRSD